MPVEKMDVNGDGDIVASVGQFFYFLPYYYTIKKILILNYFTTST